MLPLRSVGRSNFDKGLQNLTTLIKKKRHILMRTAVLYIYIYIYVCVIMRDNVTYEGFRVLDYY